MSEQRVRIADDLDLDKIIDSGQCFRPARRNAGWYCFPAGQRLIYLRPESENGYIIRFPEGEWESFWQDYFDLGRNYAALCEKLHGQSVFLDKALAYGKGIRVLRQDPWEMLVTFIISQRKSIPAIRTAVNLLSERYGTPVDTNGEVVHLFPTPTQLNQASEDDLAACGLGYRTRYIKKAAELAASGQLDMEALRSLPDEELYQELLTLDGVGKKVANCVCLFGYSRTGMVPVDVWIARLIEEEFGGVDPFPQYGREAGIAQQYLFYYKRSISKK